jgi:hypothetical protein
MELHLHGEDDPARQVPYLCPKCWGVAWTARRRPVCLGFEGSPHEEKVMHRVDERDYAALDRSEAPVIR